MWCTAGEMVYTSCFACGGKGNAHWRQGPGSVTGSKPCCFGAEKFCAHGAPGTVWFGNSAVNSYSLEVFDYNALLINYFLIP